MKLKYRGIAFIVAMLLFINFTTILGAESTTVNTVVADYMETRTIALIFGTQMS